MAFRQGFKRVNPIIANTVRNYCSAEKLVDVQVNDKTGIATITMQRPPVNSLNVELLSQLHSSLQQAADNRTRGVILTSVSLVINSIDVFCFL